ncbi:MAG TPA: Ig-like domain-containing protein [Candidatus Paceibacterota bacterium]|jgi:prepilin-type N-terminal cleavage/methylation domain-containing protein|nr:Ig-like domain-containing protein [Candidatus Paceibacterota bacterium]
MPNKRGFTLIEILVVIAIIGVLATIVIAAVAGARHKARDAERLADVRALAHGLELYYDVHGHYPVMATTTQCARAGNWIADNGNYNWAQGILSMQPRDPAESCVPPEQVYTYASNGDSYNIGITLEDTKNPDTGDGQQVSFDGSSFKKNVTQFTVTFSSSAGSPTNQAPIPITVTFSAPASSFSQSSLSVQNGVISGFLQVLSTIYSFLVTPISNGIISILLPQGSVISQGGSPNAPADYTLQYDSERPHLSLSPDPLPASVSGPFSVTINSTLALTDLSVGSILVTNGTASNLVEIAPQNGMNYSFTVTPAGAGSISVVVPANVAHSSAGNPNVASNTLYTSE